ncbi:MAG: glycosyltransferase family 1 protein [Candidatus Moraniibacteriota bacterium]
MKIGIDARFYGSLGKGLGRYTEKLITYLEQIPEDTNTYVVFLRRENFAEYQPANSRFEKRVADYSWYGWQEQFRFPWLLWRFHFDLIHFPHFNVPIFVPAPFVVTLHDLILLHYPTVKASELSPFLYWLKYLIYRVVIALAVRRARAIITVSRFTRSDIESVFPQARSKTFTTLEAADPYCAWMHPHAERAFLQSQGLASLSDPAAGITPYVLYVGNAYPHKNLPLLLRVAPRFPDMLFLCVGREDYFYRTFREQVAAAGIGNIRFTGYVDDRSLGVLYRRARAYFFPSLYEGFGLPGLEAMNVGTPVIAARAGSLPEIYGEAARYFDPTYLTACETALRNALQREERDQYRVAGFARVAQFSWQRMARETLQLYGTIPTRRY